MTDENPLLNDEERETDQRLRELFATPGQRESQPSQDEVDASHKAGERWGKLQRGIGSNVASAYFFAGVTGMQHTGRSDHYETLIRVFFDGFTAGYWVDVTDQQKSGPYA